MTTTISKPSLSREQIAALSMSTLAFAVNFAVWVMFSVIGIKIKAELNLNETEFGLLVATPILTGSLDLAAAGHPDRPLRRANRVLPADARGGSPNLERPS